MTQPQVSKSTPRRRTAAPATTALHAYEMQPVSGRTQPILDVPEGATIAIIPSSPAVARKLDNSADFKRTPWVVSSDFVAAKGDGKVMIAQAKIGRSAFEPDARARALLRGVEYAQADLRDAGGAYDLDEVRTLLHDVSRQAVDKKVRDGSLLAVPGPSNRRRFPTAQFQNDGSVVPGLQAVQRALKFESPWSVLNFLVNPSDALGGSKPIDLLRKGDVDRVVAAARRIGAQGA